MSMRTPLRLEKEMITTVKNVKGWTACSLNLLFSLACTGSIVYFGYFSPLREEWFVLLGLVTSFAAVLHQTVLLIKQKTFTRLKGIHAFFVLMYCVALVLCIVIPLLLNRNGYKVIVSLDTCFPLFIAYAVNTLPLITLLISLLYRDRQMVQNYLHPYTEIMDGFAKSSGSIQMTQISSNLKQVVVDGGKGSSSTLSVTDEADKENVISVADKANGSSPKPSKVLKTWPKADPFPVRALYSFKPTSASELPFKRGDTVIVLDCRGRWWQAQKDDRIGFIPSNYVSVLQKARVVSTFTASEDDQVSIKQDEVVEVMETYDEKSLIRNVEDKIGAVPTDRIELIKNDDQI